MQLKRAQRPVLAAGRRRTTGSVTSSGIFSWSRSLASRSECRTSKLIRKWGWKRTGWIGAAGRPPKLAPAFPKEGVHWDLDVVSSAGGHPTLLPILPSAADHERVVLHLALQSKDAGYLW